MKKVILVMYLVMNQNYGDMPHVKKMSSFYAKLRITSVSLQKCDTMCVTRQVRPANDIFPRFLQIYYIPRLARGS